MSKTSVEQNHDLLLLLFIILYSWDYKGWTHSCCIPYHWCPNNLWRSDSL